MFKRLQRRAKRLGIAISYKVISESVEEVAVFLVDENGKHRNGNQNTLVSLVEISNDAARVASSGWSYGAMIEHLGAGNMVWAREGFQPTARFQTAPPTCEHCQVFRGRKKTFLLTRGDELVQVGSTCLHDFLGNDKASDVVACFEFTGELVRLLSGYVESERDGYQGATDVYDVRKLLAFAIAAVDSFGWTSRRMADEHGGLSTCDSALQLAGSNRAGHLLTDYVYERADAVLDYYCNLSDDDCIESFNANARLVSRLGYCTRRGAGLVCALYTCHKRALEKAAEDAVMAVSHHVFEIGQRVDVEATVKRIISFDGHYGRSYITLLADIEGNILKATRLPNATEGDKVKFKATVAAHEYYRDVAQTKLQRPANVSVLQQ